MTITAPFTYIHKAGCDCDTDTDNGGTYAERLSRTRHDEAALAVSIGGEAVGWDEAVRRFPDGCCLAWAAGDGGWPGDRRDYHLIQLYRTALAQRGSGAAGWAAVERYRARRRERGDFNGYDHAHVTVEGCAPCEKDARLCETARSVEQAEQHAQDVLAAALAAAPHGAQPDGSFVTRRSTSVASGRYVHTLHAPAKQGPLVSARDAESWADYMAGCVSRTASMNSGSSQT